MGYFRAGVASHSKEWLSVVGPFAPATKRNAPGILFVSFLSLAFLIKQDLATAQCESALLLFLRDETGPARHAGSLFQGRLRKQRVLHLGSLGLRINHSGRGQGSVDTCSSRSRPAPCGWGH